jgi:hypothetical protein
MYISRRTLLIVGVLIISAVSFGIGYGQGETSDYYACVNNASGTIRMISSDESCAGNDVLIQWNINGPPGPPGDDGQDGAPGGVSGWERILGDSVTVPPEGLRTAIAICPEGKKVLGGGWYNNWKSIEIIDSLTQAGQAWYVYGYNPTDRDQTFVAIALCANVAP